MRVSLALQLALFESQKKRIRASVARGTKAFERYEARYARATQSYQQRLTRAQVAAQVCAADVIYVGDYHTLRLSQRGYLELMEAALASRRRVVLALEFVEGRHQVALEAFQAGKLAQRSFLERIGHPYRGEFDVWPGFAPIFALAKSRGLEVKAIDRRASGPRSLELRDRFAGQTIAAAAAAADRPLVLVLMGQYHVLPQHLPAQVERALGKVTRKHLVVYQNAEGPYWKLARRGYEGTTEAVEMRPGELCLVSASPVVCQQSFLDYVESEASDLPLGERGAAECFRDIARELGRYLEVPLEGPLDELAVASPGDLGPLERFERKGLFTRAEVKRLKAHILSRESAFIPRAKLVWLSSASLNHAAEEAAHFVRHQVVGAAMEAPRRLHDGFYARCLEEALGFFGSRLINPLRRCTQTAEWVHLFSHGLPEQRRIAAYVLALKAAQAEGPKACRRLISFRDEATFHAVSHALGYLLGEALVGAVNAGRLGRIEVQALFADPFVHAEERYFALATRLFPSTGRRVA
jgi:Haem-binding uptake, Tiki superfamily, ChaN